MKTRFALRWVISLFGVSLIGIAGLCPQAVADTASQPAVVSQPATDASASGAPDWKGPVDASEVHLGAITGLGIVDFHPGYVLLATASKKIVHHGFVPDISDSVSIETELGPLFTAGTAIFSYSLHLRWDFQKDDRWTIYALGGLGGYITGAGFNGSNSFMMFPRFGVGAFYRVSDLILIRGEVSHELIAAGVTIPFYL